VRVRVPASSANLGSGFDALGMAVTLALRVTTAEPGAAPDHPAVVAYAAAGGRGPLMVESEIPPGRGLGFSGAARVAGAVAAAVQQGASEPDARAAAFRLATRLEGHADNVAASLYGGVVVTAGGQVVPIAMAREPAVVVWVPDTRTSTKGARATLPDDVPFEDATFNVGRVALLVAALVAGDVDSLRTATEDRLHQDRRLAAQPNSRAAITAALDAGAWCAWLSGSGPAVTALTDSNGAPRISDALPGSGDARILAVDHEGIVVDAQ
jgi:homoserine kinase